MDQERAVNERFMMDYLLGALTESETEQLDELSMTDQDFAERLDAVEGDLVDAYVRGELNDRDLAKFQSHYLASERRREKVSFARVFVERIDGRIEQKKDVTHARPFPSFRLPFQWAIAAVLMVVVTGYLLFENIHLRAQLTDLQKEKSTLSQNEQNEIKHLRSKLTELESRKKRDETVKLFAFSLEPTLRGIGRLPQLILPVNAETVAFTLTLEPNDHDAFFASLKDPVTGKEVWRSDRLTGRESVRFDVPTKLFQTQNYFIELSGITANGLSELLSSYSFQVVRR